MRRPSTRATGVLLLSGLVALATPQPTGGEPLERDQRKCVISQSKGFSGMMKVVAKQVDRCVKNLSKNDIVPPITFEECLGGRKLERARSRTERSKQKKCDEKGILASATFGYVGDATEVNDVAQEESLAALGSFFGPFTTFVPKDQDREAFKCQFSHVDGFTNYLETLAELTHRAGKAALKGRNGEPPGSVAELQAALEAAADRVGGPTEGIRTINGARDGWLHGARCGPQETSTLVPGVCASEFSLTDMVYCGTDVARCHFCRALNSAYGVDIDCVDYSGRPECG